MVAEAWIDDHGDVEEEIDFDESHPIMIIKDDDEACDDKEIDFEEDRWLQDLTFTSALEIGWDDERGTEDMREAADTRKKVTRNSEELALGEAIVMAKGSSIVGSQVAVALGASNNE